MLKADRLFENPFSKIISLEMFLYFSQDRAGALKNLFVFES
jgi:hypothetical protein